MNKNLHVVPATTERPATVAEKFENQITQLERKYGGSKIHRKTQKRRMGDSFSEDWEVHVPGTPEPEQWMVLLEAKGSRSYQELTIWKGGEVLLSTTDSVLKEIARKGKCDPEKIIDLLYETIEPRLDVAASMIEKTREDIGKTIAQ